MRRLILSLQLSPIIMTMCLLGLGCARDDDMPNDQLSVASLIAELKGYDWMFGNAVEDALVKIGAPAVDSLIAALKDEGIGWMAARALGQIGDPRAVDPLIVAMKDDEKHSKSGDTLGSAAHALGQIGDPRAVDPLIAAMKDGLVKSVAASALGQIGDPRAVDPLIAALKKDGDGDVGRSTAEALGKIGLPAVEPLITILKDEDWEVRRVAARVLGAIGDKRSIDPLSDNLVDWDTNATVASALASLGWESRTDEERVHFAVAQRNKEYLLAIWEITSKVLLVDIEPGSGFAVRNALMAFIGIGKTEIIPELVARLNEVGNKIIAEEYLNCGHSGLADAARDWGIRNGYSITPGGGAHSVNWGGM